MRRVTLLVLPVLLVFLWADALAGQGNRRSNVTISGFPLTVVGTSTTDFDAGFILFGQTSFTVDLRTNAGGGGFSPRSTTVSVRCGAPCPASGNQVEWRRVDLAAWNALSTSFADIETRIAAFDGANDPWARNVEWRYTLAWATTPPGGPIQVPVEFQLVVAAP